MDLNSTFAPLLPGRRLGLMVQRLDLWPSKLLLLVSTYNWWGADSTAWACLSRLVSYFGQSWCNITIRLTQPELAVWIVLARSATKD